MSDMNSLSGKDDFKNLQKRLNHESIRHQFRSKLVGGLNEDDVTTYIEDIEDKLRKLEQENKKVSDDIFSLRNKFNKELEDNYDLQENLHNTQNDLDTYIVECKNKELIIQSLNEKGSLERDQFHNEINQITEERKELEKMLNESGMEIEHVKKYAEGFEEDNSVMKTRIADLEKENLKIGQLNNEIYQMSEERKTFEELLAKSCMEIEHVKKYAAGFKEDNNVMKTRIDDLEKENLKIAQLNNKILQMSEGRKAIEELLAKSCMEIEHVKKYAAGFEEDNSIMKTRIADLEKENLKIAQLNNEILQMSEEQKVLEELLNDSSMECKDLEQQIRVEKSCNEKQSKDLAMFNQKISNLEETISEKLMEIKEQRKKNEKAELELNLEKARVLSYKINGFKDEFVNIYKKVENLSEETNQYARNNNELQQHLITEQLRADKAEKDFAELSSMFYSLKDKYYKECNPFDSQFKQIVENRNQLQPEINDWIIKL